MSYVRCAPSHRLAIVRAAENHFRAVNDNHDIANRRILITPDRNFRRSVFAGHRNIFLCSKAVSISLPVHLKALALTDLRPMAELVSKTYRPDPGRRVSHWRCSWMEM